MKMPGIFKRVFAPKQERASAGVPSYGMIPPLGSVPSATGLMISQATAMAVSAVYACVAIRAKDVARCTPRLFVPNKDGGRTLVKDHIIARLFARPNRQQGLPTLRARRDEKYQATGK